MSEGTKNKQTHKNKGWRRSTLPSTAQRLNTQQGEVKNTNKYEGKNNKSGSGAKLKDFPEDREKDLLRRWFLQDFRGSCVCPSLAVFLRVVPTQPNDEYIGVKGMDTPSRLQTANSRHMLVHDDKVDDLRGALVEMRQQ